MMGRSHMIVSACGAVALAALANHAQLANSSGQINFLPAAVVFIAGSFGGVAPDVDTKIPLGGHRTWSHSLIATLVVILTAVLASFRLPSFIPATSVNFVILALYGFGYGYFFHLIADSTTKWGVPWLWPFVDQKYHILPKFLRLTTGKSLLEGVYAIILASFCILIIYARFAH